MLGRKVFLPRPARVPIPVMHAKTASTANNVRNRAERAESVSAVNEIGNVLRWRKRKGNSVLQNMLGLNCPGGGHADIVAGFIVSQKPN